MIMSLRVLFCTKTILSDFYGLHPVLQTDRELCSSGVHRTFLTQSLWFSYPIHLQSPRLFKAHPPPSCSVLGPFPRHVHSPDQSSSHLSFLHLLLLRNSLPTPMAPLGVGALAGRMNRHIPALFCRMHSMETCAIASRTQGHRGWRNTSWCREP